MRRRRSQLLSWLVKLLKVCGAGSDCAARVRPGDR
jgi:hypothetical protein